MRTIRHSASLWIAAVFLGLWVGGAGGGRGDLIVCASVTRTEGGNSDPPEWWKLPPSCTILGQVGMTPNSRTTSFSTGSGSPDTLTAKFGHQVGGETCPAGTQTKTDPVDMYACQAPANDQVKTTLKIIYERSSGNHLHYHLSALKVELKNKYMHRRSQDKNCEQGPPQWAPANSLVSAVDPYVRFVRSGGDSSVANPTGVGVIYFHPIVDSHSVGTGRFTGTTTLDITGNSLGFTETATTALGTSYSYTPPPSALPSFQDETGDSLPQMSETRWWDEDPANPNDAWRSNKLEAETVVTTDFDATGCEVIVPFDQLSVDVVLTCTISQ